LRTIISSQNNFLQKHLEAMGCSSQHFKFARSTLEADKQNRGGIEITEHIQQFSTKLHKVRPKSHLKFTGFNLKIQLGRRQAPVVQA
jgi:hypothetical protein